MQSFWRCMFSPRLYKIYRDGPLESVYRPQGLERWADKIITSANAILNIALYTSPFICMFLYKRGLVSAEEARGAARLLGGAACLAALCIVLRAVGRARNPKYVDFVNALRATARHPHLRIQAIRRYDFEFHAWPVTFSVSPDPRIKWFENPFKKCANADLPFYQRYLIQLLAFVATHTFGLRLIYPGSLAMVHNLLWTSLFQGRSALVETYGGKRTKLATAEGNHIDTMFVDKRNTMFGDVLVVCSEGNSGFYEIGIMGSPVKAGYSALGWNHPGFAGSTGSPVPRQEQNAIDAVMQFAINELGFPPEDIVLYGWSIGAYAASWAAVEYPVKALVLDATFDDLLPLAENQMPRAWRRLVAEVVRSHVDLHVAELAALYDGHVRIVRRTSDEIVCLRRGVVATNRGNQLLLKLVGSRLAAAERAGEDVLLNCESLLDPQRSALQRRGFISDRERAALRLIGLYSLDYKGTHCTPLPEQLFDGIMRTIIALKRPDDE